MLSNRILEAICVDKPLIDNREKPYRFNRTPLTRNAMSKLPLGSIKPDGWIAGQLDLMVEGMTGRLSEISPFLSKENGWFGGSGEGWEEQPYWLRGFYSLAVLTGNPRLLAEAKHWIEAVIATQDEEGYFGATYNKCIVGRNGQHVCDLWPHMVMLDAMIRHQESTGDTRIIPLMTRFFEFCRNLPNEMFMPKLSDEFGDRRPMIQVIRAGDMIPHLHWLYNRTGEDWLLTLATRFFHSILPPTSEWLDTHVIHFTERFAYPGIYSAQSGSAWHLAQSEYWYSQHMGTWGQQPRGIFGADERITPGAVDPRQGFETCGFGEFAKSFYLLGQLTGQAAYADRVEDILFNHFPASQTPDLKGLHYLTASNLPQLDASDVHEYYNKLKQLSYSPFQIYRCCQHNVAMTWPWFVENLWQASADGGLVAWLYGGCTVTAMVSDCEKVTIVEETDYPFTGEVQLRIETDAPVGFPLYLRVPRWCRGMVISVNGNILEVDAVPGQYVRLQRTWVNGDVIQISMPTTLSLTTWPRTGSVTVDRGPLSYSVKIEERYERCGGTDAWPEWEVFPTSPWNYGLSPSAESTITDAVIHEHGVDTSQPWTLDNAPIEIEVPARRIPEWKLVNETVDVLRTSPIHSDADLETITLVPLGCARLRMSCLPTTSDGPEARRW